MSQATTGLNRNTTDKYYTSQNAVEICIEKIKNILNIHYENDLCIEPSAGNGAFIEKLKSLCRNGEFYDIEPENEDIIQQNYLDYQYHGHYSNVHIIGNPPFGRQSSLAIKFIKHSVTFCNSISFILPKSFKKDSLKKHFPIRFHLEAEIELPDMSFTINGNPHNVPCVFQIWKKKDTGRIVPVKLEPKNFNFVKKSEEHDISFRRVGVYAGKIDKHTENKSVQSHYFIKFDNFSDVLFDKLSLIDYKTKNNTVGARSISKQELIKEFNMIL
jgi:hypothetical protein